ncbi:MAG: hypothetical protein P1V36_05875, partial [Planctomycetota bacterium]|nr:hypothetical protein [Planctomycetota bacterium]
MFSTKREFKPASCPEACLVEAGGEAAFRSMGELFCRFGALDFGRDRVADGTTNDVSDALRAHWRALRTAFEEARGGGRPVRALLKHYPRPDMPGTVVTIQVTVYTLPDLYLDRFLEQTHRDPEAAIEGVLVRLSKTYRLGGSAPRLIEAWAETAGGFRGGGSRLDYAAALGEPALRADDERESHF